MKNIALLLSSILFLLILNSCAKDKICTVTDPCAPTMRHFPMAIGNYWIYEVVNFNTVTNTGIISEKKDTIQITGDTIIRNNRYHTFIEKTTQASRTRKDTSYYRDSIGYIVNHLGDIKFTAIDFDKVHFEWVLSPWHLAEFSIQDSLVYKLTPKGYFECLDFSGCLYAEGEKDSRVMHNYYSKDIGLVYSNLFYSSPNSAIDIQRSLYDFHLE